MRAVATQKLASKHNDTLSIATTSIAPVLTAPYTFEAPRTPDPPPTSAEFQRTTINEIQKEAHSPTSRVKNPYSADMLKFNMGDRKGSVAGLNERNERKGSQGLLSMDMFRFGDKERKGSTTSLNKVVSAADLMEDPQATPKVMQKQSKPQPFGNPASQATVNAQAVQAAMKKTRDESLTFFKQGTKGVGLDDFTFLAVLGKGNFGKVMLAQEKFTNAYYGIKVLKKEFILEHDEVERYFLFCLLTLF